MSAILLPLSQAPMALPVSLGSTAMAQHWLCLLALPRPGLTAAVDRNRLLERAMNSFVASLCSALNCFLCKRGREDNRNNLLVGWRQCGAWVSGGALCGSWAPSPNTEQLAGPHPTGRAGKSLPRGKESSTILWCSAFHGQGMLCHWPALLK